MDQLPVLGHDQFEILVTRELRKAGFDLLDVRRYRRTQLSGAEQGYLFELTADLARGPWHKRALIACRCQTSPVGSLAVESVSEHVREAKADVGLLFATAELTPEALEAAHTAGVALLRVVDARIAYDTGGWGAPGHYPAWLPAYLAQIVEKDAAGQIRHVLLEGRHGKAIVELLTPAHRPGVSRGPATLEGG